MSPAAARSASLGTLTVDDTIAGQAKGACIMTCLGCRQKVC